MQETDKKSDSAPSPPPPSTPPHEEEVGEEEGREGEDPCPTHLSSGYASSDSSGAGVQGAATPLPGGETVPLSAIQSDPQVSAFRPALNTHQVIHSFIHSFIYPFIHSYIHTHQVDKMPKRSKVLLG